jgi:hypothetical protein
MKPNKPKEETTCDLRQCRAHGAIPRPTRLARSTTRGGDILTVVIVAMRAMLTRRSSVPDGTFPEADRRGYEKFCEARSIQGLSPQPLNALSP